MGSRCCEPRHKGGGLIWEGLRTPPKADLNYPALTRLYELFFSIERSLLTHNQLRFFRVYQLGNTRCSTFLELDLFVSV
jgi:hypothetical protein